MSFSKFTQKDYDLINQEYEGLKEVAARRCRTDAEMALVQKAFEFANEAHKNVRRRSGEPYMLHPIAVARIVVESIGLGCKSICAAILHDVVEDTDFTIEDIRNLFGDKIASLVDGLTKIKTVLDNENKKDSHFNQVDTLQAENFKRILLTLNDDVRVVLIKLADRLHNCRTIEFMPEHKRDKVLSETMFIFIPLAHRLGLYEVKSEMENIWLKYKEPDAYREISQRIDESVVDKDKSIDEFIAPISAAPTDAGFKFEIKKRIKTPYSVWNKMRTKNVEFEQVYDLYAVRIIFTPPADSKETERNQCYHIFSIITGIYKYQPSRVRDWVRHPKSNGYEALHCTLMSQIGIWIDIILFQNIRSVEQHREILCTRQAVNAAVIGVQCHDIRCEPLRDFFIVTELCQIDQRISYRQLNGVVTAQEECHIRTLARERSLGNTALYQLEVYLVIRIGIVVTVDEFLDNYRIITAESYPALLCRGIFIV